MKPITILGTGIALPKRIVASTEIDRDQGLEPGQTEATSGVSSRHYATDESATDLAVAALHSALARAGISLQDIDCLLSASGTMEQAIPCNAAKIHAALDFERPIPAFDINMTCLSCLMGLDLAGSLIASGQYKTIALVSSDIASVGVDWGDADTAGLFGDGAACLILTGNPAGNAGILASHFATYSEGLTYCQIRGGGSLNHPSKIDGNYKPYGIFEMKGKEVFKLTSKMMNGFVDTLLAKLGLSISDIDWVIPHQASLLGLQHIQKRLKVPDEKYVNIIRTRGNQIAASIPSALHEVMASGKVRPGDKAFLLGTSAGLSIGGVIISL